MATVSSLPVIPPDPEARERLLEELAGQRLRAEVIFEIGYQAGVESMTPPAPRPALRLVT